MTKQLLELRKAYAEKKSQYDSIKETGELEEVRSLFEELRGMKERIELLEDEKELELKELETETPIESRASKNKEVAVADLEGDELEKAYTRTFIRAFRSPKDLNQRDREVFDRYAEMRAAPTATPYMQTAVDADGGFLVPKEVSTKINEYRRQEQFDLTTIVDVEVTSVISGEFTYQTLADAKPMRKLAQWDVIPEGETPQYERKSYKIEDYAEIIPLPRTLLQDTDQNILNVIAKWIARKTLITRNMEIMKVVKATFATKKTVATVDDFKDVLYTELDPAFRSTTQILTNQEGFTYLSKLKYDDGRYVLATDPHQTDSFTLLGKPVIEITSKTLPTENGKAPIFVGDFREAIRFYDRGVYEVTPTMVGGDSFKRNSLDTRIIDRFGVIALDPESVVACEVDTSAKTTTPKKTA